MTEYVVSKVFILVSLHCNTMGVYAFAGKLLQLILKLQKLSPLLFIIYGM